MVDVDVVGFFQYGQFIYTDELQNKESGQVCTGESARTQSAQSSGRPWVPILLYRYQGSCSDRHLDHSRRREYGPPKKTFSC